MSDDPAYINYWRRKRLLAGDVPHFPVRRWWRVADLCDVEQIYFEAIKNSPSVLDVGAGDLQIMHKLQEAGYGGEYHTQDIGHEYAYTYRDLSAVKRSYGAIICLDVIEHLPLSDGLAMINQLINLLDDGGVLIIQTPNARCVRHPLSWDMTHLHCYSVADLWAYVTCCGLAANGYRVAFGRPPRTPVALLRFAVGSYIATRLLGCDYADNILVIARKLPRLST